MTEVATQSARDVPVPCFQCGYDLRRHDDTALCPECGTKTYWSLHAPKYLSEFPQRWVATMSWAARLLAIAYTAAFVILLANAADWLPRGSEAVAFPILTAVALLQAIGAWLLSQWSGHQVERRAQWLRWGLCVSSLAPIAMGVFGCVAYFHYGPNWIIWCEISAVISVFAPTLTFFRMGRVARLISNPALAEHSTIVTWGMLISSVALPLGIWAANHFDPNGMQSTTIVIMVLIATALLLFILWAAFLMTCCVVDFGRAARLANQQWKANSQGL